MNSIKPNKLYSPEMLIRISGIADYDFYKNLNKKLIKAKYSKITGLWYIKGSDFLEWYDKQ